MCCTSCAQLCSLRPSIAVLHGSPQRSTAAFHNWPNSGRLHDAAAAARALRCRRPNAAAGDAGEGGSSRMLEDFNRAAA